MDPARTLGVFALDLHSIGPLTDADWGGAEHVGCEEMLNPHFIETTVRVMTPWRFYDEPSVFEGRNTGYTADVALAQGRDGVRAVLHYHTSHLDPHETPPAITVGSLLRITCPFDWYPGALGKPIPVNVPILDLWYAADFATVQEREA